MHNLKKLIINLIIGIVMSHDLMSRLNDQEEYTVFLWKLVKPCISYKN